MIVKSIQERIVVWGQRTGSADVMTLMLGTVIAQGITYLSLPLVSRLYSADSFGLFAGFIAIATPLTVVCCGRFELGINIAPTSRKCLEVLTLSLLMCLGTSILCAFVTIVGIFFSL